MNTYLLLLRGINVGGKNKISMTTLKQILEDRGFRSVTTFIQSGNIILQSNLSAGVLSQKIENLLSENFTLDSSIIKVLALTRDQLRAIIKNKPEGFGEHPETYHSDVIFLMGIDTSQALSVFSPKEGVDKVWPGEGVIYSQRLSALRTKSRLNKIVGTTPYKSMTIRNWNTTVKLLQLLSDA